jgi:ketosteroid isomerase-like protein
VIEGRPRQGGAPLPGELSEDAAVVRAMYRALEERDPGTLARLAHPGIEWVHPLVTRLPFDGTLRGLNLVLRAAFRRNGSEGPRVWAGTFLELGDGVLVVGRFLEGIGAEETEEPFLHECHVKGGRVVRIREYPAQP